MHDVIDPLVLDIPDSFESERLIIRVPRAADAAGVQEAIAETIDDLSIWMPWARTVQPIETTRNVILEARQKFDRREDFLLFLFLKSSGHFVGGSGLHRLDWRVPRFEIGYWVRKRYHGCGYATEAVNAITDFAFATLHARRVEIRMSTENLQSVRVARRAGFQVEGVLRNEDRNNDGTLRDTMVFSKIRMD